MIIVRYAARRAHGSAMHGKGVPDMTDSGVRDAKLTIPLNAEEVEIIDRWRFENRLPSRAAAARELIGRGIKAPPPDAAKAPLAARDVGVLASSLSRATDECFIVSAPNLDDCPIIYASPAFYEVTGYSPSETIGRNCRFLQGAETKRSTISEIRECLEDERVVDTEILNYCKDGTPIRFHLHIEPVISPEDGALMAFVGRQHKLD